MRRSELLRRAEAYLWDGFLHGDGERFLCPPSLEGWLEVEHGIDPNSDLVKLQATRRAWLAWMVRYWQERGQ